MVVMYSFSSRAESTSQEGMKSAGWETAGKG